MKNLPKKIYLQIDADGETPEDFKELVGVTWCTEKINANDIEFILNEGNVNEANREICVGSNELIGSVKERYNELKHKNWEWHSFYNGWLEGRVKLLAVFRGWDSKF